MYVDVIPNRGSPPAILLRESYREGGKVKKRTMANLSNWPQDLVKNLKRLLNGAVAMHPKDILSPSNQVLPTGM